MREAFRLSFPCKPAPGPSLPPWGGDKDPARGFCRGGETAVRLDAAEGVALLPDKDGNPYGMASNGSLRGLAPSPSRLLPAGA